MTVTIKRKTGWLGMASNISVKVNGEKVVKIAHTQEINIAIQDSAHLTVIQFGSKSNEIVVKDGDIVEITTAKWSYIVYCAAVMYTFLMNFISTAAYKDKVSIVAIFIIFLSSFFLVNTYRLKIINNNTRSEFL
ncbi:hypothetical protein [Carnobacterium mobile]|uniref:hypothetical protein n=1 Tax=Carnobacterium mobile TaxID=2750 RepID=UPI001865EBB0|nr:hypothetical protein [Carnobacterium mobile]